MSDERVPRPAGPTEDTKDSCKPGDLVIIGTAHVSPSSLQEVEETILELEPDVVAVELCERRFVAPLSKDPITFFDAKTSVHLRTIFFLPVLQYLQTRTATEMGLKEKTDMGVAVATAARTKSSLALIDRDILTTFNRYWTQITRPEQFRMTRSIGGALVRGKSTLMNTKEVGDEAFVEDSAVKAYVESVKEEFPTFTRVFIDERDRFMAKRLQWLQRRGYSVVAVVGAAHKPGVLAALEEEKLLGERVELQSPLNGAIQGVPDVAGLTFQNHHGVNDDHSVAFSENS